MALLKQKLENSKIFSRSNSPSGIVDHPAFNKDAQQVQLLPTQKNAAEETLLEKAMKFSIEFGPSRKDILNFTNQFAVMIKAGISIDQALRDIGEQVENKKFKEIIFDIKQDIVSGQSISQALAKYPDVFGNLYVNMIAAAEISGSLSSMLEKLAGYLDQEADTRSQVRGAMVYPIIIATMAVTVTTFLLAFVLPRFVGIFEGKEHLLPTPTKIIMGLSAFLRSFWFIIIPVIAAAIWGFITFVRTYTGKFWWDRIKLKMPVIRKLCRSLYITRSLNTMGILTNAGVPILETISITAEISGNIHYKTMWKQVHDSVRQGKKIALSLANYQSAKKADKSLMPTSVVQMIRSGEESGSIANVLTDISDFYARELKAVIKTVTSMIEPIMIVLMGFVVGFIAMSIILPIFKMSNVVH